MIDFSKTQFRKMMPTSIEKLRKPVEPLLIGDEEILLASEGTSGFAVFTNIRLIFIAGPMLLGKKKDYTILPYSRIQAFSVETAGFLEYNAEVELLFTSIGKVKLEFTGNMDVTRVAQIIGRGLID